jgi:integrase
MASGSVIAYNGKRGTVWRIKYRDATDKQVMETVGAERDGVTRKHAEAELRERLVRVERKGYRRPKPLTFGEYAERWFSEGEGRRGWKPATILQYRAIRGRLVKHFGTTPLAAIRPRDVAGYVSSLTDDLGAATISRDVSILHAIFSTAKREELVETNPAERAERPKLPRRKWRILEPAEVARVSKAFTDEQARVVFLTLVLTGLRRSELQALRWRDVDLLAAVLRVRDSKTEDGVRSIALSPGLVEALSGHYARTAYKGDAELVFCHPERGTVYRATTFQAALEKALAAAGITDKLRPFHDLRHTAITNDAAAGASPIAVMAKAGHANMRTTQTYLHLAGVVFRDEAERLERRLLASSSTTAEPDRAEPSTPISTRLSEPDLISADLNRSNKPESVG